MCTSKYFFSNRSYFSIAMAYPSPGDTAVFHFFHHVNNVGFTAQFLYSIPELSPLFLYLASLPLSSSIPSLHTLLSLPRFPLWQSSSPLDDVSDFCQMHFPLVFERCLSSLAKFLLMSSLSPDVYVIIYFTPMSFFSVAK